MGIFLGVLWYNFFTVLSMPVIKFLMDFIF